MRPDRPLFTAVLSIALLAPRSAAAVDPPATLPGCFTATTAPSALAADPAATQGAALPVTLATGLRLSPQCTYGLAPDPARMIPVPPGETDFGTLAAYLTATAHADPATRPRTLYARSLGRPSAPLESAFRESCTESLLADRASFDSHVDTASGALEVSRHPAPAPAPASDCGAARTVLRFLPVHGPSDTPPGISSAPAAYTLDASARSVTLGANGEFAVYAGRTPGGAGILVGHVGRSDPLTALRHALAAPPSPEAPWLRGRWSAEGDFELERAQGLLADQDVWPEMVTAAAADELWLADATDTADTTDTTDRAAHAPLVLGRMRVGPRGDTVVLPPDLVTAAMTARFGPAGRVMVPTLDEWDALRRRLQICLVDRYAPSRSPSPARVPDAARCARLARVVAPVALAAVQSTTPAERTVCLRRTRKEISVLGATAGAPLPEVCVALPSAARPPGVSPETAPVPAVMVGDQLAPQGPADDLFCCIDNHCRPLPTDGVAVWQQGLVELRHASGVEAADRAEGVTLLRLVAVDPVGGWLPAGLYTGSPLPQGSPTVNATVNAAVNAWAALDHDEPAVFSFVRRRQALAFRLATSPAAAAVWNARAVASGQGSVLTDALPVVGGLAGSTAAPPPSGLVVLVTRDETCPAAASAAVRASVPVDPDALLVDQRFHVYLARAEGDSSPYECLAHASFRVRESRALAPLSWLHVGLWGDTQAAVFLTDPAALGVVQPLAYAHARLPWGFGAEAALDLTAAVTFDHADVSRAGAGLGVSLGWGPLGLAPRLVSVGLMLHLATGTAPSDPLLSPYAALDLSTLLDAAGGR